MRGIRHEICRIAGGLPPIHYGALAYKALATGNPNDPDGEREFRGMIWVLWSNEKLAAACIRKFENTKLFGYHPTHAFLSNEVFKFGSPGIGDWSNYYCDRVWL